MAKNKKGAWSGGRAPAQGRGAAPIKSKAGTASNFTMGLDGMVSPSKASDKLPTRNNSGASIRPRKGVFNPGAIKP